MSLIAVDNTDEYIEHNDVERLIFTDGWNGGGWNNWDAVNNPNGYRFFVTTNNEINEVSVDVKEVSGLDIDMGHNYHWNSLRVFITVESLVGLVTINTLNIPKGSNLWYMKK